jgi:hypothetical protein
MPWISILISFKLNVYPVPKIKLYSVYFILIRNKTTIYSICIEQIQWNITLSNSAYPSHCLITQVETKTYSRKLKYSKWKVIRNDYCWSFWSKATKKAGAVQCSVTFPLCVIVCNCNPECCWEVWIMSTTSSKPSDWSLVKSVIGSSCNKVPLEYNKTYYKINPTLNLTT